MPNVTKSMLEYKCDSCGSLVHLNIHKLPDEMASPFFKWATYWFRERGAMCLCVICEAEMFGK